MCQRTGRTSPLNIKRRCPLAYVCGPGARRSAFERAPIGAADVFGTRDFSSVLLWKLERSGPRAGLQGLCQRNDPDPLNQLTQTLTSTFLSAKRLVLNAVQLALRPGRGTDSEALQRNSRVDTGDAARVHGRVALRRLTTCDVLVGGCSGAGGSSASRRVARNCDLSGRLPGCCGFFWPCMDMHRHPGIRADELHGYARPTMLMRVSQPFCNSLLPARTRHSSQSASGDSTSEHSSDVRS